MTGPEAARRLLGSSILKRLAELSPGGGLFLTGGSLRDRLLGLPSRDLDLAVTGDARRAARDCAVSLGGRCLSLGRPPLITWRVVTPQRHVDFWGIQGSVEADIMRRDFTVNALYWRLSRGPLLDLVGGLDDLAAGRLQVVRAENLADDPVRVLRGIRLTSTRPQFRLTAQAERLLAAAARGLHEVARERVVEELRLLLAGPAVERALLVAARLGVLGVLRAEWEGFPETRLVARLARALEALRRPPHGALARGARDVAPAVLAAPAAGFPTHWQAVRATEALRAIGWPATAAERAATAAGLGERLTVVLGQDAIAARELAAEAGDALGGALAWAAARAVVTGNNAAEVARRLLRWGRRFAGRPGLLDGDEIATLLGLPAGPARAAAVLLLRRAQARGDVRTGKQARRFLAGQSAR